MSSTTNVYSFLNRVEKAELATFVARATGLAGGRLNRRDTIYRVLWCLYGYELLYERDIRQLLLDTLSFDQLQQLTEKLGKSPSGKTFDLVVRISTVPWRPGSAVARLFADTFSIPHEYLPSNSSDKPTIELLEPFDPPPALFDYQETLVAALLSTLNGAAAACLLQLPTGAGKTRTTVEALARWKANSSEVAVASSILWLAHTEELCEQAAETIERVWHASGSYPVRLVRFWGTSSPTAEEMHGAFIVAGYQKLALLYKDNFPRFSQLAAAVGVTVVDEAHKTLAPTISRTVSSLRNDFQSSLVGLTATPGRGIDSPTENRLLAEMFESRLVTAPELGPNPIHTLQERGILARVRRVEVASGPDIHLNASELEDATELGDLPQNVLHRLAENEARNERILEIIQGQVVQGRQILVFACSVDHARRLATRLTASYDVWAATIDAKMRRATRRRVVRDFRSGRIQVLLNYGVLSAGFDAPNTETVLITRPTTSIVLYSQMVGRGLRGSLVGGGPQCTVIDVRDNFENFGEVGEVYSYFDAFWQ